MEEVLKHFANWPVTIPIMLVILCLVFREAIAAKIREISFVRREDGKTELGFFDARRKGPEIATPDAGDAVIEQSDVLESFKRIRDLREEDIKSHLKDAHVWLRRNGVVTKKQLDVLTSSDSILGALRTVYIEELGRPPDAPLDPIAVATWGAGLFKYGVSREVLAALRRKIKQSPEYKSKWGQ